MKSAYLPLPVEWVPIKFESSWVDCFRFPISAQAGLPPASQARILRVLLKRLTHFSDWLFLWVELDAPGTWYSQELNRLTSISTNIVITPPGVKPKPADILRSKYIFSLPPRNADNVFPDLQPPARPTLQPSLLRVLRTLARLEQAQTLEIASLSGFCKAYTHTLLYKLERLGYARRAKVWKYPGWVLTRRGLLETHRSWNIPPKTDFRRYRCEHSRSGPRHRRVARLWRSWLETAFPYNLEIWDCWTEFAMHPGFPDALAWGTWQGRETIFWLEVDTGHGSKKKLCKIYTTRYYRALNHAAMARIPMVFAILAMPWVLQTVVPIFNNVSNRIAVIAEDWRRFGTLPVPEFGHCRIDYNLMKWRPDVKRSSKQDWSSKFAGMKKQ